MTGAHLLLAVAPLHLTYVVLVVATAVIVLLLAILVARHGEVARADRRRERVRGKLAPVFETFLETDDPVRLAEELRPAFMRMDAAERPVAAILITDLMQEVSPAQKDQLRRTLELAGLVTLGERGTRRFSPWRRALACELLGKIGAPRTVPALLERLEDRRPEVRLAAVRALGDIGSAAAVGPLTEAFLERRAAPTNLVADSLLRIGGEAGVAFERGISSPDPIVRISSCFGLAKVPGVAGDRVPRLAELLGSDPDARVRTAAAAALFIVGGDEPPATLRDAAADANVHVRRSAVKALGAFDDPSCGEALGASLEDEDREVALRAAEALLALAARPRAAPAIRARLDSTSSWAIEYATKVAEVSA